MSRSVGYKFRAWQQSKVKKLQGFCLFRVQKWACGGGLSTTGLHTLKYMSNFFWEKYLYVTQTPHLNSVMHLLSYIFFLNIVSYGYFYICGYRQGAN